MTYTEALEITKARMERHQEGDFYSISPASLVRLFQDFGLKLDEPKSTSDKFIDILEAHAPHSRIGDILRGLDIRGLKIVEK